MEKNMKKEYMDITKFIFVKDEIEKADIIMIPGSSRIELAIETARIYNSGLANRVLVSGGKNKKLKNKTEARFLKDVLIKNGVRAQDIILEDKAKNTYENAKYSYRQCILNKISMKKIIVVCKSYHSRRVKLAYEEVFPESCEIIIVPIIDRDNITSNNWYEDSMKKKIVFGEVEKIGKYMNKNAGKNYCR